MAYPNRKYLNKKKPSINNGNDNNDSFFVEDSIYDKLIENYDEDILNENEDIIIIDDSDYNKNDNSDIEDIENLLLIGKSQSQNSQSQNNNNSTITLDTDSIINTTTMSKKSNLQVDESKNESSEEEKEVLLIDDKSNNDNENSLENPKKLTYNPSIKLKPFYQTLLDIPIEIRHLYMINHSNNGYELLRSKYPNISINLYNEMNKSYSRSSDKSYSDTRRKFNSIRNKVVKLPEEVKSKRYKTIEKNYEKTSNIYRKKIETLFLERKITHEVVDYNYLSYKPRVRNTEIIRNDIRDKIIQNNNSKILSKDDILDSSSEEDINSSISKNKINVYDDIIVTSSEDEETYNNNDLFH